LNLSVQHARFHRQSPSPTTQLGDALLSIGRHESPYPADSVNVYRHIRILLEWTRNGSPSANNVVLVLVVFVLVVEVVVVIFSMY